MIWFHTGDFHNKLIQVHYGTAPDESGQMDMILILRRLPGAI